MEIPPKRRANRSERRAAQRGASPELAPGTDLIPRPPAGQCAPWHFYWCDGHQDWHHHEESALIAIEASFPNN